MFVVLEVFDVQVHAIAPVVAGIGRDVDTLGISIFQTQVLVGGKPVLKGDDAEHGWAVEMTLYDMTGELTGQRMRRRTFHAEDGVVVVLRTLVVLVPPHSQGWSVVT